jgi:hypothetical protein
LEDGMKNYAHNHPHVVALILLILFVLVAFFACGGKFTDDDILKDAAETSGLVQLLPPKVCRSEPLSDSKSSFQGMNDSAKEKENTVKNINLGNGFEIFFSINDSGGFIKVCGIQWNARFSSNPRGIVSVKMQHDGTDLLVGKNLMLSQRNLRCFRRLGKLAEEMVDLLQDSQSDKINIKALRRASIDIELIISELAGKSPVRIQL